MNPLYQLLACGQSFWMDDLTRGMIKSGELKMRVAEQGLRGVTTNPSIFNKAVRDSSDYDDLIRKRGIARVDRELRSVKEKCTPTEIYEELVVRDVRDACDILRPVFEETKGADGFVSLEVSPHLAHDTEATITEARRLFERVGRLNLLIKIPGTAAGLPAIEQMLYEGIPVNITLLFSVQSYEAVAKAYIRALERRGAEGKPVDNVASVASFFLSRIDVLVEQLLSHRLHDGMNEKSSRDIRSLQGKVAVANAKLAYQRFRRIFSEDRWKKLKGKNARVQRPLWASTGTKNPSYTDVHYIEPLIGPHTVTTMPAATMQAFATHGTVVADTVMSGVDEAGGLFESLESLGIDFECVTWQLLNEGIEKFIYSYDALIDTLREEALVQEPID